MNFKNFISYFSCLLISGFIAYFINGKGGVMLCICLISAFLLSVLNFILVKKKLDVNFQYENILLRKGETFSVKLAVSKHTFLPTPYIEVKFKSSPKLSPMKAEIYKTALFYSKNLAEIKSEYKTLFSGKAFVEIEYVKITDFLGLFSQNIFSNYKKIANLKILPDIPENVTTDDLLKTSSDAVAFDDSDEDTGETIPFGQGTPGYEHRPYVVGDPVKKINWKLSSKRDIFMLRLDEKIAVSNQVLILDVFGETSQTEDFINNDILIEGFLGLARIMLFHELTCECWCFVENDWQMIVVKDEKSLFELQKTLENYDEQLNHTTRLPLVSQKEKGEVAEIIFSNNLDVSLVELTQKPSLHSFFVTTPSSLKSSTDNVWCIDKLFEIKRA